LKKILFQYYIFCIAGITPLVLTLWRKEEFYDGKIVFAAVITGLYALIQLSLNTKTFWRRLDNIEWLLVTYVLLVTVSTAFSIDRSMSIWGQEYLREGIISLLLYIAIFYLCYREFKFSNKTLAAILMCAVIISIYGMLQYYGVVKGATAIVRNCMEQRMSTLGNRNFAGTYSMLFLPVAFGLYLYGKRVLGLLTAGILFGLLMASQTRSAWIAMTACLSLFFIFSIHDKGMLKRYAILMLLFAAIFGAMNYSQEDALASRAKTVVIDAKNIKQDSAGSGRIFYWKRTLPLLFQRPWLGSGPDTYGHVMQNEYGQIEMYFPKAHNEYLQMLITLGWPATIVYLMIVGSVLMRIAKQMRKNPVLQVLFCCITGYLVQAFFNISTISTAPVFWAILGIGAGARAKPKDQD
jgi:putative inorganic carbon (HCO3(-)) transporter